MHKDFQTLSTTSHVSPLNRVISSVTTACMPALQRAQMCQRSGLVPKQEHQCLLSALDHKFLVLSLHSAVQRSREPNRAPEQHAHHQHACALDGRACRCHVLITLHNSYINHVISLGLAGNHTTQVRGNCFPDEAPSPYNGHFVASWACYLIAHSLAGWGQD